jgi:hypothetical protein
VPTKDEVVANFKTLSADDQAAVRQTVLLPPPAKALADIWKLLLSGLFVVAIAAGIAAFVLYWNGNSAAGAFIAITTTVVGALIGLIAPSPVASG